MVTLWTLLISDKSIYRGSKEMPKRSKYEELLAKEADIRWELSRARTMPRLEVLDWLDNVKILKKQVKIIRHFRYKEVDQLLKASHFAKGLFVSMKCTQCPQRSQLLDTILANVLDPYVGITSIFGSWGVGKTTSMMKVSNELTTYDIFDSIFWVKVSTPLCLRKLQDDIAQQMNMNLSMYEYMDERAAALLERLQKLEKYLIIFDELWKEIPLKEVGIPQPSRENGCKIVLIARDLHICRCMGSDKFILVESEIQKHILVESEIQKHILVESKIQKHEQYPNRSQLLEVIWQDLMDPKIGIISIFGIGGIGKTTTMMKIRDQLATSDIFDKIIWVTVSKYMNLHKVQSDIALQMNLDLSMYEDVINRADMIHEKLLKIKNFLIIFDDLWEEIDLKRMVGIPKPYRGDGCKIVLTTRKSQICHVMKSDKSIKVEVLSGEEAWELFVTKAGSIVLNPEVEPVAKQVVQKCSGIPIIIISIGIAMKDEVGVEEWRKALEDLSHPLTESHDIVLDLLRFCYNRLRNDKVKNCFLYCANFPEDYHMKPEELIRYWMAEGLIHEYGDIIREIDDGYQILTVLLDANMLEMFTKSGDEWLKMHDLSRDLARQIMEEEGGVVKKVSLMRNQIRSLDVVPLTKISTLLLQDNPITHIVSSFFCRISSLKFLDLSYSWITELPPSLSDLAQLRVLFLHYCRNLKKIPTLEKLKELQVLTLCGTLITELPHGMEGLTNLRSLDLSDTTKLASIRVGLISSLSRLEELRMQGSGLCKMDSPTVANYLMETRSLKCLAILTFSSVGYGEHLESIMWMHQERNLKIFSINVYGSIEDYIEDVETVYMEDYAVWLQG